MKKSREKPMISEKTDQPNSPTNEAKDRRREMEEEESSDDRNRFSKPKLAEIPKLIERTDNSSHLTKMPLELMETSKTNDETKLPSPNSLTKNPSHIHNSEPTSEDSPRESATRSGEKQDSYNAGSVNSLINHSKEDTTTPPPQENHKEPETEAKDNMEVEEKNGHDDDEESSQEETVVSTKESNDKPSHDNNVAKEDEEEATEDKKNMVTE